MPVNHKILGQTHPSENTVSNVYVVPESTSAIVNSLFVVNQLPTKANVDIIIRPIDETLADKHYLLKDKEVDASNSQILNLNLTLDADTILAANVYPSSISTGFDTGGIQANVSFSAFGVEIT
jgi:hypothetical protein